MASGLYHFYCDEVSDLDLNHSAMACHPFPCMHILEDSASTWFLPPDDSKNHKRLKGNPSIGESIGSSSMSHSDGTNSLPMLQFRDYIWSYTRRYLAAEAAEGPAATIVGDEGDGVEEEGSRDEMRLVQLLISCAEAVACRDRLHALALLSELRANALVFGTSFQRVASCFVQGLASRVALVQPLGAVGTVTVTPPMVNTIAAATEKEEAFHLVYELCPHIQFGHFVANASIMEAFEGDSSIHVVDLGMTLGLQHGHQWRELMHSLANRPCRLRITGVGRNLQTIGNELEVYARSLGISFEFSMVESNLENLRPEDFKLLEGEILVLNSILQLHSVLNESRGALTSVLQIMHKLSPKVLVLVEQDSSHNGPFFLGRFMESLHYYSAIFDSLDAMLPKYDTRRAKIEQFYFAEEIKNIVSYEGPARVERHERIDQWRRRMSRAGFQPAPVKMIKQAKQWLGRIRGCEGYTIVEEKGCLVLGWKSKPIVAASCWKC